MDYWKYESLIEHRYLHFTCLANLNDPLEGKVTEPHLNAIMQQHPNHKDIIPGAMVTFKDKDYYSVSCWTMNEHEAQRYWDEYTKSPCSVAIRSSFGRLCASLPHSIPKKNICRICYLPPNGNPSVSDLDYMRNSIWLHKSHEYEWENELRACLFGVAPLTTTERNLTIRTCKGWNVIINLSNLIERVVMHPSANQELGNRLSDLHKRHNLSSVLF